MLPALTSFTRRTRAAVAAFTRSYDGASLGRRMRGAGEIKVPIAAMQAARGPLAQRARYQVANNPLMSAAVEAWTTNVVGAEIKADSQHPTAAAKLNDLWKRASENLDADGLL